MYDLNITPQGQLHVREVPLETPDRKPSKAGIDPLNKLIDRRPKDNAITVEKV